ncbi:MAG: hypothetical protein IJY39_08580 [Clostridia bacterium]|nr:hypothetical protein [Clostridia bacterium]
MIRSKQLLNGWWDYRIADGKFTKKLIPYSDPPVGFAECKLDFDALKFDANEDTAGKRAFLVFDGITYSAEVTLNGTLLGKMLPYCEYRYEITDLLKSENNRLSVIIRDTEIVFGAGEGWENYSGITRDVYIEYFSESFIENVFFHSEVSAKLTAAECVAEVKVNNPSDDLTLQLTLCDKGRKIAHFATLPVTGEMTKFAFTLSNPILWSPDCPTLYTLEVELIRGGEIADNHYHLKGGNDIDSYCHKVGFKRLETRGKRFYLNGSPFFLLGVCRHEIWGEKGHMLTDDEIRQDLTMIKNLGCNYCRLVHYPHRKKTLEIADEIGLFVSEEPGLWWSDMKDQQIVDASLEVLRRTVIRDRNHVSVAFWLAFNECIFTPEFIKESGRVCREYDPYRMVSGANCMSIEMTKQYFKECGFDFYTMHPYHTDPWRMTQSAKELTDMPLVFTEWGGHPVFNSPFHMKQFITEVVRLWQNDEDKEVVTGASFWCFSEMYEINRAAPACYDGLQCEGLVDRFRKPTLGYQVFRDEFAKLHVKQTVPYFLTVEKFLADKGNYTTIDLSAAVETDEQKSDFDAMMKTAAEPIPRFYFECRNVRHMAKGPVLPEDIRALGELPVLLTKKPVIIKENSNFDVEINASTDKIHLIGMTSMPKGYPIDGGFGEEMGEIVVSYADGSSDTVKLRNGYEITTACAWYGPSRINPVASEAPRAIKFINDMDREHFVANLYSLAVDNSKKIQKITLHVFGEGYNLLIYGVTV